MIAVRLVVLAVLGYIAWLLIRGLDSRKKTAAVNEAEEECGEKRGPTVEDILVEDPVCHALVPKRQAIRLRRDGTTYFFCSDACCDKFAGKARGDE